MVIVLLNHSSTIPTTTMCHCVCMVIVLLNYSRQSRYGNRIIPTTTHYCLDGDRMIESLQRLDDWALPLQLGSIGMGPARGMDLGHRIHFV
jgi:hypothetical protein